MTTKEERKAQASNPDSSLAHLMHVVDEYPDEVLANPVLPLLSLEDPDGYQQVHLRACIRREKNRVEVVLKKVSSEVLRRKMIALAEHYYKYIGGLDPRTDTGASPFLALGIAQRYLSKKASRQALSWASRYAQTFIDWKCPKGADEDEIIYTTVAKISAELCKACCVSEKKLIWEGIEQAVFMTSRGESQYHPAQFEKRLEILKELLAAKTEKPTKKAPRKKPCACGQPHCRECGEP
jgi:hypothetical protein